MDKKGWIKKVFPGGNTAKGFYSYYDNVIDREGARLFIIKGGPGVGKSSFMKNIGYMMVEQGYDVEFHQCSSDNGSLDGIVIPALKIGIIDGTAPHVVDPKYPGAADEIINFGEFWNQEDLKKNKEKIIQTTKKISKSFTRAYKFFGAAKSLRDDMEEIYEEALDRGKFNLEIAAIKDELLGKLDYEGNLGKIRNLFGSALTPNGLVDYYETIIDPMDRVYYFKGSYVKGISNFMEEFSQEAVKKGLNIEIYHEPMDEKNIQTMIISKIGIALTSSKKYREKHYKKIDLDGIMDSKVLINNRNELLEDQKLMEDLIERGVSNIQRAKKEHDILENLYIPNMNFKEIDRIRKDMIFKILEYGKNINN